MPERIWFVCWVILIGVDHYFQLKHKLHSHEINFHLILGGDELSNKPQPSQIVVDVTPLHSQSKSQPPKNWRWATYWGARVAYSGFKVGKRENGNREGQPSCSQKKTGVPSGTPSKKSCDKDKSNKEPMEYPYSPFF